MSVEIFGESIKNGPHYLKNKIGHVSEKIKFNYPLPVNEFIKRFGLLYDRFDYEKFNFLADKVKLDLSKHFSDYSRGQKMQIVLMIIDMINLSLHYSLKHF